MAFERHASSLVAIERCAPIASISYQVLHSFIR